MFCMRCGNENPDDAVFCRKCGYTMQSVGQQITPPVPEPEPAAHRYASADQATLYGYPIKGIIALMLLVAAFLGLMQPGLSAQLHYVKLEFDAREYNLPHVIQMFVSEEEILPTAWSIENENEDEKQILHFKDEKAIHTCFCNPACKNKKMLKTINFLNVSSTPFVELLFKEPKSKNC